MARLSFEETMDRLLLLIRAGYPVIYLVTHEEDRALDCLARLVRHLRLQSPGKTLARWTAGQGIEWLQLPQSEEQGSPRGDRSSWLDLPGLPPEATWHEHRGHGYPFEALDHLARVRVHVKAELSDTVAVFFDLQALLTQDPSTGAGGPLVRPVRRAASRLRAYYEEQRLAREAGRPVHRYKTFVVVSPSAHRLSPELEREVIVLDLPLPEQAELERVARDRGDLGLAQSMSETQRDALLEQIAGAGRGLTLKDYTLGLNMMAVQGQSLSEALIEQMLALKAKSITNDALTFTPNVEIELGGLEPVKEWVKLRREAAISRKVREQYKLPAPRWALICGVSGGGKSQLAKLIAKTFQLALLRLDVGALFGSYVGESEQRTREALALAEVLAPVVLWLDEVDKAFSGMDGAGDNGVAARVFGHFLTWMSERSESVFVVATANDISKLIAKFPEFGRKGRFDEVFWVDLPGEESRREIFRIYLQRHLESGLLTITAGEIEPLHREAGLGAPTPGWSPFEHLVWILGSNRFSQSMTGAEIENAVHNALYMAFDRFSREGGAARLDPGTIADAVFKAKSQALYADGGGGGLAALHAAVQALHPIEVS